MMNSLWKIVFYLDRLQERTSLSKACSDLHLEKGNLLEALNELRLFGFEFCFGHEAVEREYFFYPSQFKGMNVDRLAMFQKIELALEKRKVLQVFLQNHEVLEILPHRIAHLDGRLSLLGENCLDRTMLPIGFWKVQNIILDEEKEYSPNFSSAEIEDFIEAFHSFNEKKVRLVLKVNSFAKIDFSNSSIFMVKPYMTSNPNGEIIWAASVEPNEDLLSWIFHFGKDVEILTPSFLREEFRKYCLKQG